VNGDNRIHYSRALPDFNWINGEVPILEVAKKLGLVVRGKKTTCPECGKRRLTFTTVHNGWKCWSCDPGGKMRSVIDLVMAHRQCPPFEAAKWISENWEVAGRVQIEFSENSRGEKRHTYRRYQPIPIPDKSQPSIEALVASPGWRAMPLSVRVIAVTLLAMAVSDGGGTVSISRRMLGTLAGVHKPAAVVEAVREMEAIGLFAVDKGSWGDRGYRASTFRLTWFSQAFQAWLSRGYAPPSTIDPNPPKGTSNTVPLGNHPPPEPGQEPSLETFSSPEVEHESVH